MPLYFCPVISFYLISFFPRLISAAAGWMSTIPYMVWYWCEFRMQVRKVLHAARCKCRTQKTVAKNRHLCTIPQFCRAISSQLRHASPIGKELAKQQYLLYMFPQYGELGPLAAEIV